MTGVTGPLFAFGGQLGGIGFYLDQGRPTLCSPRSRARPARSGRANRSAEGNARSPWRSSRLQAQRPAGRRTIASDPERGPALADERVRFAIPTFFGIGETFGVGTDEGSPVLAGYPAGTPLPAGLSNVLFDFNVQP